VCTDDHGGRYIGRLEDAASLRDQLTVTSEHDCLGWIRRDVRRDLPTPVVIERLGDELSRSSSVMRGRIPRLRAAYGSSNTEGVVCRTLSSRVSLLKRADGGTWSGVQDGVETTRKPRTVPTLMSQAEPAHTAAFRFDVAPGTCRTSTTSVSLSAIKGAADTG
jgi:hypothetical protein